MSSPENKTGPKSVDSHYIQELNKERSLFVGRILIDIGAVHFYKDKPFDFSSGIKSPIYVDCRQILSYPKERKIVIECLTQKAREIESLEVVAGVATGGIPYASFIAEDLDLPLVYVRPDEKSHGLENRVEGLIYPGKKAIVIEDTTSSGGASVKAIEALRARGLKAGNLLSVFSYGFSNTKETFRSQNVNFQSLTTLESVIYAAEVKKFFNDNQVSQINAWAKNPQYWPLAKQGSK